MPHKSGLPYMTFTPAKTPKPKAPTPAAPPEPPAEDSSPEETPPSVPEEQPETDAPPAAEPTACEGSEEVRPEDLENLASGKDKVESLPDTPLPNRAGKDKEDRLANDPLVAWSREQFNLEMERLANKPDKAELRRRAPILDDSTRKLIVKLIAAGMSRRMAAKHVGISHTTIGDEIKRNMEFANLIREAEMQREYEPLAAILAARQRSWRAAAWILERVEPERYGKRIFTQATPEELYQALSQFAEFVSQHLGLDADARDQLLALADALSRQAPDEASELLRLESLAPTTAAIATEPACGNHSCTGQPCTGHACSGQGDSDQNPAGKKSA